MTETADALASILEVLATDATITALTSTRIFGAELPEQTAGIMPKPAIVVRWAGGFGTQERLYSAWRVDIHCYGPTPFEAGRLHRTVHARLKNMAPQMVLGVKLYAATESGGPISLREPDTSWPVVVQSWSILFADDP